MAAAAWAATEPRCTPEAGSQAGGLFPPSIHQSIGKMSTQGERSLGPSAPCPSLFSPFLPCPSEASLAWDPPQSMPAQHSGVQDLCQLFPPFHCWAFEKHPDSCQQDLGRVVGDAGKTGQAPKEEWPPSVSELTRVHAFKIKGRWVSKFEVRLVYMPNSRPSTETLALKNKLPGWMRKWATPQL